jgi:replication factor C subunit 3/5
MLEATKVQAYPFTEQQALQMPDWEVYIQALAKEITQEQSPQKLLKAREMLYELLTNCIPADVVRLYKNWTIKNTST